MAKGQLFENTLEPWFYLDRVGEAEVTVLVFVFHQFRVLDRHTLQGIAFGPGGGVLRKVLFFKEKEIVDEQTEKNRFL